MENNTTNLLYVEYDFKVVPQQPWNDVLMAQLGEVGFESFIETDHGIKAYILQSQDSDEVLEGVSIMKNDLCDIAFAKADVPPTNWNAEWEKNFDPIIVNDRCEVRAPFHKASGVEYDIVIEPKMSFGTGHHQTTHMMIEHLLKEDLNDLDVLDIGSGTGVLAILAQMRGAKKVDAIDIDTWCYENALENVERNNADKVNVILGGAEQLDGRLYDFIIANINRNILLQDIPVYAKSLKSGGTILFSGFYEEDLVHIQEKCNESSINYDSHLYKDNWIAVKMIKDEL
ncbi:ribosomal protein L11 methyltransferase [Nonlabens dokdonensis]|jgi:ribosomal protein L11 methyltransferase|uniref:Ribosomal protein L11 methyltransferase n=2 Tax=Nonlabens dokdonensis TaxID=328515 RepID=L7W0Z7_NONDD|nr:50S ribosomal protein L11 methyltransferase [Nonlabens dokdonensis]AGC75175.1 ribosomal protein L11 methyltransferase [Nonlabens dokdonensis DSW-6]PZX39081.1 ribosomal protein L11 methyltransferase [Nonlabens dokdonensis]